MKEEPKISIGLPVYNGERYLTEAIESILNQTWTDFELIICDNGSTDGTEYICRSFAARDARIRYFRSKENRGAAWNYNRTVELARGPYFKWMAHDDVHHPDFLRRCLEVLENDASVVLAYSDTVDIDENGRIIKDDYPFIKLDFDEPHRRLRYMICINHPCFMAFGVVRTEILRETDLIGSYVASDRVLLADLCLRGRIVMVPEKLFYHREHVERSTRAIPDLRKRIRWFDTKSSTRLVLPHWRLLKEYARVIARSPLTPKEKLASFFQLVRWLRWYGFELVKELGGLFHLLRPGEKRQRVGTLAPVGVAKTDQAKAR